MRNAHPRFMCFPSVVQVGKETEVTIVPRDNSRIFREEKEYELCVIGLREDLPDYHSAVPRTHNCTVSDGCLKFTHTFEREQEYSVRFCEKGTQEIRISMYAVNDDLYELRPLKGDLHTHSYYSDGQDGVAMIPANYREEGFDFFALTDHNRMFTSCLAAELYDGIPLGMHIMKGEEVHTPGSSVHIVHIGGRESVCDKYIHDTDGYNSAVDKIAETMDDVPESYRRRVAMAKWACDEIHKADGLAIFAHPFWCPNLYNVSEDMCNTLFDKHIFDAFELFNGSQVENNMQIALWQEQMLKGNYLPVVANSDSHNHDFECSDFARRFTIVFAKENTTEAILEAIKNDMCVAAELPIRENSEIRFHCKSLRLVMFCHFLYKNYFNETWRLCVGEGILMRRYAEGEDVGDTLASMSDTVENFYKKFYGLAPAPVVTAERRAFLDKAREVQCTVGPITKGSHISIYGGNERRE